MKIKDRYNINKLASVGASCTCPSCGVTFDKVAPQQAFCKSKSGTKCKDKYWNTVTPSKRCNTTRISPASKAWLAKMELNENYGRGNDYDDDPSWDAHKDSF
jgi:hypothetical protein